MNLILTMAGKYSRFRDEGYTLPKYLLPWGNRSILSEILYQLLGSSVFNQVFLIANKSDNDFLGHVKKIMAHYQIDKRNLIIISDTVGQAQTAFIGLSEIRKLHKLQGPIVFHNIDTILYNRDLQEVKNTLLKYDGHIDVFKSNNHNYSYVLTNNNLVEVISEKILISDLATSGLYGFSSYQLFIDNYDNENYISEIYKTLITEKFQICTSKTYSEKETIVLGTPNEYLRHSILDL
jgi:NDP-sugar pyrophosphorylase family protein